MDKKIVKKTFFIVLFVLLCTSILSDSYAQTMKKYSSIEEKINYEGSANVIVRIKNMDIKNNPNIITQNVLKNKRELRIINAYAGELNKKGLLELKKLEKQGYIVEIYEDKIIKLDGVVESKDFNVALDNSVVSIGANYIHNVLNITGKNITVAVIDSGIYYNHTDLGGGFGPGYRVKDGYDFVNMDDDPLDDYGHGTHVAGIIGANGTIKGVAPDVEFIAIKSCDNTGVCDISNIISGIEWAVDNGADIISMSLGGSYSDVVEGNSGKDSVSLAVEAAFASGKPVIIAAGNTGPAISTINVPGAAENAITVGSVNDNNTETQLDDVIASSSSRGPSAFGRLDPDIVAPGVSIYSTYLNNNYQTMSGTSMAAPHVTGVVALMLEKNPSLTPSQTRRILLNSAVNISDYVFNVGSGEVNAINALTYNISATVKAKNTYNIETLNDRWEFIIPINGTESANITIINDNPYEINFTAILTDFYNNENAILINKSQFSYPQNIVVPANSNYSFIINFTTYNFSSMYATTYGGKLLLFGNDSKNITIPIIVTVPIKNYANIVRTFNNFGAETGDVLFYAYYNNKSGNEKVEIRWANTSSDLDLYVYNSTGDIHVFGGYNTTENETLDINSTTNIKWIRIHAYNLAITPFNFSINITDLGNNPPNITNVTNQNGINNFNFTLSQNITIIVYFNDIDNDILTVEINDSRYNKTINTNNATFTLENNISLLGTHSVRITVTDDYGAYNYIDINVTVYDVRILSYYPSNSSIIVKKNDTINFTQTSEDPNSNPLYYYWYINGTLNSTEENFTLDTTNLSEKNYNITFLVSNTVTNTTISWNLTIDDEGPTITISRPLSIENNSIVIVNITAQDISGINSCWYNITGNNTNIYNTTTCGASTNIILTNGNYTIHAYSNDSYGFIGYNNKTFTVNDITPPQILSLSPSGSLSYRDSVTLEVNLNENSICRYDEDNVSYSNMARSFSSTGTTNRKTISVEGGTSYIFYVKCADLAGNINTGNYYFNFSIREQTTSSSGGSGGGGGGSISNIPSTIQQTNSKSFFYSEVKDNFTINVNSDNIALKKIIVYINKRKTNVDIKITDHGLDNIPTIVNSLNNNVKKYTLLEIKHTNLENEDIIMGKIQFAIPKFWIQENNINENLIKVYRYTNSWNEISATKISSDNTKITYEATIPGLSYFIIGGIENIQQTPVQQIPSQQLPPALEEITGNNVLERKDVESEKPLTLNNQQQNIENKAKWFTRPIFIIIIIALIITIITADVVVVKKRNERKLMEKQERIENLKKQYLFEGNQLIQEYNTRVRIIGRDPNAQQKILQLRAYYNQRIRELHDRYSQLINQIKNS
ncbi:MAG: S8 family serine peptidase [Candidatus Woesearchaeota archaeon]